MSDAPPRALDANVVLRYLLADVSAEAMRWNEAEGDKPLPYGRRADGYLL